MIKATINLTDGRAIRLELFRDIAPITVDNFVKLADSGFYNGLCFHRVIENFMIQGGGFEYKNGLVPKSSPSIKGEFAANGIKNTLHHECGVISMARTNVSDSASSQFFICVADCGFLDGQYAAFGKTIDKESTDVAVSISKVQTGSWLYYNDVPREPVVIANVVIDRQAN